MGEREVCGNVTPWARHAINCTISLVGRRLQLAMQALDIGEPQGGQLHETPLGHDPTVDDAAIFLRRAGLVVGDHVFLEPPGAIDYRGRGFGLGQFTGRVGSRGDGVQKLPRLMRGDDAVVTELDLAGYLIAGAIPQVIHLLAFRRDFHQEAGHLGIVDLIVLASGLQPIDEACIQLDRRHIRPPWQVADRLQEGSGQVKLCSVL